MIRIKYPNDGAARRSLTELYIAKLAIADDEKASADLILKRITFMDQPLSFDRVVLMDFQYLKQVNFLICHFLNFDELEQLVKLFYYKNKQPNIADFFMEQRWISLDSCFYCNLDSIYAFADVEEYVSPLAFVNTAEFSELRNIEGLGKIKAEAIISSRAISPFTDLKDVPVGAGVRDKIKALKFANTHSHFTIDHFHHKDLYSFISISLFNLVPCCYSCNSKFKKTKELGKHGKMGLVSPSSPDFDVHHNFSFKLFLRKEIHEINTVEDFAINSEITGEDHTYTQFLRVFKIMGRYHYHKTEALQLIRNKVEYPDSRIRELAEFIGKTENELQKDLFGKELFERDYDQKQLVKFKRDIARSINIRNTLPT
jgi:hypothetical protein